METEVNTTDPSKIRTLFRKGGLVRPTAGLCPGKVQANLVILPIEQAFDFLIFCQRNPKPCPLVEVVEAGGTEPMFSAQLADLRTDVASYRVYRDGELHVETEDVSQYWRDDLVSFLLGCSFTFESALIKSGIFLRHFEKGDNVPMYKTNIDTVPAGIFSGSLVVSMRPIRRDQVVKAVQVTSRFPAMHGAPIHIGDPSAIGIEELDNLFAGDYSDVEEDEVPVFWACGVTPQAVAMKSKPPLMITHSPGSMFITDLNDEDFAVV